MWNLPFSYVFRRHSQEKWYRIFTRISNIQYPPLGVDIEDIEVASLEWGQAPKPPSFVALRATTQSTRWSLKKHLWRPKNKREWQYVEFSSGDGSIFTQKLERISKNLGGNPSWALPTRDCPLGFWIFSLVFSWIFCHPPSLTSTYCYFVFGCHKCYGWYKK